MTLQKALLGVALWEQVKIEKNEVKRRKVVDECYFGHFLRGTKF